MPWRAIIAGCAAVAVAAAVTFAAIESWSPEAWGALAAWITAAVAVAAGYVALGQLGEARQARLEQARLRKEQAQPYVVAYMEFSEASTFVVDLVVRNFGATAAHDVHLAIDPWPRRSIDQERQRTPSASPPAELQEGTVDEADEAGHVWLPERIPVLVPGQEWRTLWDTGRRMDTDLPDHHEARITFQDSQGESYYTEAVLDWCVVKDREMATVYGAHHAATALRDLSKAITTWKEGATGGLSVYVRDGDAKDRRWREHMEARRAERAASERPTDSAGE